MPRSNEGPDLGIDTTPRGPVNLQPGRRRRKPSAWDEGMLEALPRLLFGLLALTGIGFLGLVAEGLTDAGSKAFREAMKPAVQRKAEAERARALMGHGGPPDGLDRSERDRARARAEEDEPEPEDEPADVDGQDLRP